MARLKFTRNSAGIAAILKSVDFGQGAAAERVASMVRGQVPATAEVVVDRYTTDRRAASVTIKHPFGMTYQVRDGVLTRAASAAGLEVSEGSGRVRYRTRDGRVISASAAQARAWAASRRS